MPDRPEEISSAAAEANDAAQSGLVPQLAMMFRALLESPVRRHTHRPAGRERQDVQTRSASHQGSDGAGLSEI
jgi:hypothetical protein